MNLRISDKSWKTTVIWLHLFGIFGAHRFYVGKFWTGLLWLFTGGGFVVGALVDMIMLYTGNFTDGSGALVLPLYKRLLIDTIRRIPSAAPEVRTGSPQEQRPAVPAVPEGRITLIRMDGTDADVLAANDYVVFDTETTGLNHNTDKVIEMSLLKVSGGKIVDEYCTLVNPEMHIPSRSTKIHGICDDDVKDAPHYDEVGGQMVDFLGNCLIVGHNVKFDLGFLGGLLENVVLPEDLTWRYVDTIPMAKAAYPGMEDYKLQTLVKTLGIETAGAHRAHADTLATRELFELCRARLEQ